MHCERGLDSNCELQIVETANRIEVAEDPN